jgi:hypothetical protein
MHTHSPAVQISSRVDGAELLEQAEAAGQGSDEYDYHMSSAGSSDTDNSDSGEFPVQQVRWTVLVVFLAYR